jgi:hypothetical protein
VAINDDLGRADIDIVESVRTTSPARFRARAAAVEAVEAVEAGEV